MKFAAMGYHTMILRYSVARTVPEPQMAAYPCALLDLAKAMAEIKRHAAQWRVDADRVAICGFSAGGHLCAEMAVHWQEPRLAEKIGVESEALRPAAAILVYALTDLTAQSKYMNETGFRGDDEVNATLMGHGRLTPEEERSISPAAHVTPNCPPCFLVHAANDFLVPVENTLHFAQALTRENVPYALHVFETGSHGFSVGDATSSTMAFELQPEASQWIKLADAWLNRHMPLTVLPGEGEIPTRGKLPPMGGIPQANPTKVQ